MNWPIGMGPEFQGIYDRHKNRIEFFRGEKESEFVELEENGIEDSRIAKLLPVGLYEKLCDDIVLLDVAGDTFDRHKVETGNLTPVFFGSAISNFGVQTFLDEFLALAPSPQPLMSNIGLIDPVRTAFSGFIFKIQANMNPAHRDRIAFLRVCSGRYERGMYANHVRTGKRIKLPQPQQFLAQDRNIAEEAYPGDIVGLFDPGIFRIGDTLCEADSFQYEKLPQFTPEHFARVTNKDTGKYKQFQKGISQLAEEGTVQVYRTCLDRIEDIILGVVGQLQFEVFEHRLLNEYGVKIHLFHLPYRIARWVKGHEKDGLAKLHSLKSMCVIDQNDRPVVLFENEFNLRWHEEKFPNVNFMSIPEN